MSTPTSKCTHNNVSAGFLPSWLAGVVGMQARSTPASKAAAGYQAERMAEIKRQNNVSRELGPPPFAPQPPKGQLKIVGLSSAPNKQTDIFMSDHQRHTAMSVGFPSMQWLEGSRDTHYDICLSAA